jgi:hypothetical protein
MVDILSPRFVDRLEGPTRVYRPRPDKEELRVKVTNCWSRCLRLSLAMHAIPAFRHIGLSLVVGAG